MHMEEVKINNNIKIKDGLVLIKPEYAKQHLTRAARSMALRDKEKNYVWTVGETSCIPMYELPTVFGIDFMDIMKELTLYAGVYLKKRNLTPDRLIPEFEANEEKIIK